MTPLAWSMLFVGIAIGLLGSVAMCLKVFKEEMKSIQENYEFIKKWSDLTDEQYKNFEDYFNKRMDLIHDAFNNLCDINSRLASDNDENMNKLVDYSNRMRELLATEVKQVDKIRDLVVNSYGVNDERWALIQDYITNYDPMDDHYQAMINERRGYSYEHADVAEENGTSEGGNAGDQESEQAPMV